MLCISVCNKDGHHSFVGDNVNNLQNLDFLLTITQKQANNEVFKIKNIMKNKAHERCILLALQISCF